MRREQRAIAGVLLAPFLALTLSLAPEHLHPRDAEHPHAFIHSHPEPHDVAAHDHDGAEVEHAQEHVVWLTSAVLPQTTYHFDPPAAVLTVGVEPEAIQLSCSATTFDEAAPPHGPPRDPTSLRGPPSTPHLI